MRADEVERMAQAVLRDPDWLVYFESKVCKCRACDRVRAAITAQSDEADR